MFVCLSVESFFLPAPLSLLVLEVLNVRVPGQVHVATEDTGKKGPGGTGRTSIFTGV